MGEAIVKGPLDSPHILRTECHIGTVRVMDQHGRVARDHIVRVEVVDREVVGGVEAVKVVDADHGDGLAVVGAQGLAGFEIAGVDPSVGAG